MQLINLRLDLERIFI